MSRKHYRQVAGIIRQLAESGDKGTLSNLAEEMAWMFRADNPRFDSGRFYEACGMNADGEWVI